MPTTPISQPAHSSFFYAKMPELAFSCKRFEMAEGKIKTLKLKLNNPGSGTPQSCGWTTVAKMVAESYRAEFPPEKVHVVNEYQLHNMEIFNYAGLDRYNELLKLNGHFEKQVNTYLSRIQVMHGINKKKPVCICLKPYSASDIYAVVIYGYTLAADNFILHIADTRGDEYDVDYINFSSLYQVNPLNTCLTA